MNTADSIAEIVRKRNDSVKPLLMVGERCANSLNILNKLQETIANFVSGRHCENDAIRICSRFLENIPKIKDQILYLQEKIMRCRKRFERKTINIGFGGKRGQGKSFLLQKFSGLSNDEVPSGSGKTVTAVRSEIFNDASRFAKITFYDESGFLREVITPYCTQLNIPTPGSIEEFSAMKLPESGTVNELQVSYINKLKPLRDNVREYASLLTGATITEKDFSRLRQYVAYNNRNGNDTFIYAAVKEALIHTPFPETNVAQLGMIDLPGLGELNPTVSMRHTSGFGEEVDMVMLIRRPVGPRVDWDNEDQKALETLNAAMSDGDVTDFVVIVQNEGDCDPDLSRIALKSIRETVSDKFKVLRTQAENCKALSAEVLEPVLAHLAQTLPISDGKVLDEIKTLSNGLWTELADYTKKIHDAVKRNNDSGYPEEEMQEKAEENRARLAALLEDSLHELERKIAEEYENERLVERIEAISAGLKEYVQCGLGAGSLEKWVSLNADRIAADKNISGVFTDNAHQLRVRIAEDFAMLNEVYSTIVDGLLDTVAEQLDKALPGFLCGKNGRSKLEYFKERLESSEKNFDNITEALESLLDLKIEHRTQFYPRAYDPIRSFMQYVRDPKDIFIETGGKSRDEMATTVFEQLSGVADRVILEIVDRLNEETMRMNDILFVALEYFDDKIIRSRSAQRHWERFIKAFYPEVYGTSQDAADSAAVNTIMAQMRELEQACN